MNEIIKDITPISLQLKQVNNEVKLTKGQQALLTTMRNCVQEQKSIDWDAIVSIYYKNVSSLQFDWYSKEKYDIMEIYKSQNSKWQYVVRPKIRQWFVSTIGILVLKNQLIVIPTISIED